MSEGANVTIISSKPTDVEKAQAHKASILSKLDELCGLIDKAALDGFRVSFNLSPRWDGKEVVTQFVIAKHF